MPKTFPQPIADVIGATAASVVRDQCTLAALRAAAAVHPDAEHVGTLGDGSPWLRAPSAHVVATCVDPAHLSEAVGVIYARVPFQFNGEEHHVRVYSTACVNVPAAFEASNERLVAALRAAAFAQ
jgi:hypothetical protein